MCAVVVLAAAAGTSYWVVSRPPPPPAPPEVDVGDDDPAVSAAYQAARAGVVRAPRSAEAWGFYGMFLLAHKYTPEAHRCFTEAGRLDPREVRWRYYNAVALSEDPESSIAELQKAVDISPDADEPMRLQLGEGLLLLGRTDEAGAVFDRLLARNPDHARARLGRARLALARGDLPDAEAQVRPILDHPETRKMAHTLLAEVRLRQGDRAAAERERAAVAQLPDDAGITHPWLGELLRFRVGRESQINRAVSLVEQGRPEEAERQISETVRDYPRSAVAWLWLGRARLAAGDLSAALDPIDRARKLDPELAEAHFYHGVVLFEMGRVREAQTSFLRATQLRGNHALAWYNLGQCQNRLGDPKAAVASFEKVLRHTSPTSRRPISTSASCC
ncbi:MAG: tetratricopeptide repeat protein [Gemmataceae bacterium]